MFLNRLMIKFIKKYQSNTLRQPRCRHIPSCSNYSLGCYKKFNFVKATFLTSYRIIRCNPLSKNVYDPVPLTKKEKMIKKEYNLKASIYDNDLLNLYQNNSNITLSDLIKYIYESHFNTNNDINLFYARLDRIIYLSKKKKLPFKHKYVKEHIYQYLSENTIKDQID